MEKVQLLAARIKREIKAGGIVREKIWCTPQQSCSQQKSYNQKRKNIDSATKKKATQGSGKAMRKHPKKYIGK